jgi:hypothetical protein
VVVWRRGLADWCAAASAAQGFARVADVHFVLDKAQRRRASGEGRWAGVRLNALGMSGHSFGAATTSALAGKRYPVPTPRLIDTRLKAFMAFMAFSPAPTPGEMPVHEQFGAVHRPYTCLTGSHDGDRFGRYTSGDTRWQVYEALPRGAKAGLWLQDADRMSFADQVSPLSALGPLGPRDARAVVVAARQHALIAARGAAAARHLGPEDRWRLG